MLRSSIRINGMTTNWHSLPAWFILFWETKWLYQDMSFRAMRLFSLVSWTERMCVVERQMSAEIYPTTIFVQLFTQSCDKSCQVKENRLSEIRAMKETYGIFRISLKSNSRQRCKLICTWAELLNIRTRLVGLNQSRALYAGCETNSQPWVTRLVQEENGNIEGLDVDESIWISLVFEYLK